MGSSSQSDRLIIIGGSPRSGTTLLQNMLDCHPDILGAPEFLHLPDIIELRKKLRISLDRKWINLICSYEDVDNRVREMIEGFLIRFADKQETNLLCEKTPESVLVFSELAEVLPETRFIHIVRDPRATIASLLEVGKKAKQKGNTPPEQTKNIQAAVKCVKQCLNSGFKAIDNIPNRLLTIRYEDLTNDPEAVSKKVCEFLGIGWHPALCSPNEQSHIGEHAITVNSNEIWYDKKSYNRNPTTESLDKWKKTLSTTDLLVIEQAFKTNKHLLEFGYNLSLKNQSIFNRISANLQYNSAKIIGGVAKRIKNLICN